MRLETPLKRATADPAVVPARKAVLETPPPESSPTIWPSSLMPIARAIVLPLDGQGEGRPRYPELPLYWESEGRSRAGNIDRLTNNVAVGVDPVGLVVLPARLPIWFIDSRSRCKRLTRLARPAPPANRCR